jgi:Fe-S oxidoreductase
VREALDLCLACKGCKGDCPVNVDMATYKAEFLSHYWAQRIRPRYAYAFGLINLWSQLASLVPGVVNLASTAPGARTLMKFAAGMPQQREVPQFAPETFKSWWRKRPARNAQKPEVVLFADTFNNHFHPDIAQAAVEVLEAAGYQVRVPLAPLCCGRPLYDYGMLDMAKSYLKTVTHALAEPLRAGTKVVVLEPSCASVFRDELVQLFPHDEDAKRLSQQTLLLSEFIERHAAHADLPRLEGRALVHGHCHHKSLMKMNDELQILRRLGLQLDTPETGCCGMAGAFGFERDHYDVSMKVGERVLLPSVREAAKNTLIVSDGFSCHEQIAQTTDRQPLHLAQVLDLAMNRTATAEYPERAMMPPHARDRRASPTAVLGLAAIGLGIAGVAVAARRFGRRR